MSGRILRLFFMSLTIMALMVSCISAPGSSVPSINDPVLSDDSNPPQRLLLQNRKVAVLVSNLQWDQWVFEQIFYGLELEGAEIVVISTTPGFMTLSDKQGQQIPVYYFEDVDIYSLDALVVTGGEGEFAPDNHLDMFLQRFDALDRVIGAVSGGTAVLSQAGLLAGVKIAIEDPLKARMSAQGAVIVMSRVYMDGKYVTASARSENMFMDMLVPAIVAYRDSALLKEK